MIAVAPRWRLIIDETPAEGAWNMALDRAIQVMRNRGEVPATLRLYSWTRPTVTLGRFQDASGLDRRACDEYGIDVVRRFTGGRGVLHDDELTYAAIASVEDGIPRGTAAAYRHLCTALVEAYLRFGLPEASLTHRARGGSGSGACYLHATPADLSLGTRKLSGSAQVWMGDTVLQHGSFVISRDTEREAAVFALEPADRRALVSTTATLSDFVREPPSSDRMRTAVVDAFSSALGVVFDRGEPTAEEVDIARELLSEVAVGHGGPSLDIQSR